MSEHVLEVLDVKYKQNAISDLILDLILDLIWHLIQAREVRAGQSLGQAGLGPGKARAGQGPGRACLGQAGPSGAPFWG